jgi:hypothetical protein
MDIKEERIAIELAKGKPDYKAYQAITGCDILSAKANASTYLQEHPEVRKRAIDIISKREDLSLDKALNVLAEGMQATNTGKYGTYTEWTARLENAKVLLKLYNELSDRPSSDIHIDNRSIHIELNKDYIDTLNKTLDRFDSMMKEEDVIDGEIVRSTEGKTDV